MVGLRGEENGPSSERSGYSEGRFSLSNVGKLSVTPRSVAICTCVELSAYLEPNSDDVASLSSILIAVGRLELDLDGLGLMWLDELSC